MVVAERDRGPHQELPSNETFLDAIGRSELKEKITSQTPIAYWTMELYRHDIQGGGGLGILAGDTSYTAERLGISMVFVTPLYPIERSQSIENFEQAPRFSKVIPERRGFERLSTVTINTRVHQDILLDVYKKQSGSVTVIGVHELDLGELYEGNNNDNHRLYQEVAGGFGGYKALKELGLNPSFNQINEGSAVFGALAHLDDLSQTRNVTNTEEVMSLVKEVKEKTGYTNHTLVQAAEPEFSMDQFEHFVMPNIQNGEVRKWIRRCFKDNKVKLSVLALELSGKRNGVSLLHAQEASKQFADNKGNRVVFEGITNGINLERWVHPEILKLYKDNGILDEFGLTTPNYQEEILALPTERLKEAKDKARQQMRSELLTMKDQYGQPISIPQEAKVFGWARRFAEYKRPRMLFEDQERLGEILEKEDAYILLAGKAHQKDTSMQQEMTEILKLIDRNPVLKARVHFIQNYNEDVSRPLVQGVDGWFNTPRVLDKDGKRISTEADGTSKDKTMANSAIDISTNDGGMADPEILAEQGVNVVRNDNPPYYLEIKGSTYEEEVDSLYTNLERACAIIDNRDSEYSWDYFVKRQLSAYLPIISDSRMLKDYINYAFPKEESKRDPHEVVLQKAA